MFSIQYIHSALLSSQLKREVWKGSDCSPKVSVKSVKLGFGYNCFVGDGFSRSIAAIWGVK